MRRRLSLFTLIVIISGSPLSGSPQASATEPGWTPRVLKLGEDRARTNAQPIIARPYRPLHFYGNAVRRRYHRGTVLPTPTDVRQSLRLLLTR